ncbi:MAG: MGMT family protein [Candidatus Omnitrophota bacterium]|nr:MGMT family protein [Candidatus Omnitrophota bacterium]
MKPFTKKVYQAVLSIPLGEVRSYKWVAHQAGNRKAYRAVGTILNKNPFPIMIPCHRVIKSNNILGGYIFGQKRKKEILDLERELKQCLTNKE